MKKIINLTPKYLEEEHGKLEFYQEGRDFFNLRDSDLNEINMFFCELANIPQVKALIEALESLQFNIWNGEKSSCPNCGFIAPNHDNDCKIRIALAPFKMSAGDKQ